jgi:hypothetical protein
MAVIVETPRVVVFKCSRCASAHADLKPGVLPAPLPGQKA